MLMRNQTTHDYSRRIERVVAFIGANLDADLALERLAEVACFSPYHFHRVYAGMMGETVTATVVRLRLARAAGDLVKTRQPVAAIARQAGYGSAAAFIRAFRTLYDETPGSFRRRGNDIRVELSRPNLTDSTAMQNVTIVSTPAYHCAAIDHIGPYDHIGAAFDRLTAWAKPRGLMGPGSHSFGIYYDDPNTVPPAKLRSAACLTIGPDVTVETPFRRVDIPGGRHARLQHRGPYAELEQVYRYLYETWLPASGERPANSPCFEAYLNDCKTLPPSEWLTDVYLPLAPKTAAG